VGLAQPDPLPQVEAFDILLVEDDPHDAELTLLALKHEALDVRAHLVGDGTEALALLFDGPCTVRDRITSGLKLVLLDLKLPKISGLEVLRRIKSDDIAKTIPVVVLSSSSEARDVAETYGLGANSYLVKPVRFDQFIERVSRAGSYWLACNHAPR
jgi:CheY-like chemotaxis protein